MRLIKLLVLFGVAFLLSLMVILTFMQQPFHQTVPARLVFYQTAPIPIYVYLLMAFGAGLCIGLGAAAVIGISLALALRRKDKELKAVRGSLDDTQRAVRIASAATQPGLPPDDRPAASRAP